MKDKKSARGASAVEFALILPVLCLLLFGLIDFGRIFFIQISLEASSREAVRASALYLETEHCVDRSVDPNSIVHPDCSPLYLRSGLVQEVTSYAQNSAPAVANVASLTDQSSLTVEILKVCSVSKSLTTTEVRVSIPFKWITPINIGGLGQMRLSAKGFMRCSG